jgi:hypothetical protein
MQSGVSGLLVRIHAYAHQFSQSRIPSVVHNDAAECCEGTWSGKGEKSLVSFAHPVGTSAVGNRVDGEASTIEACSQCVLIDAAVVQRAVSLNITHAQKEEEFYDNRGHHFS